MSKWCATQVTIATREKLLLSVLHAQELPMRHVLCFSMISLLAVAISLRAEDEKTAPKPLAGAPKDINNAGQAAGVSLGSSIFWNTDGTYFLSARNVTGSPIVLNDSGYVTHGTSNYTTNVIESIFWNPAQGQTVSLPSLGGNRSEPFAMNEQNQITGFSTAPDGQRAVLWQPTGPIPVGSEAILAIQQTLRELLASEQISEGDFAALMAKLTGADAQLRAGNTQAAMGVLKSAQKQIEQLMFNGFISVTVGLDLIDGIEDILITL